LARPGSTAADQADRRRRGSNDMGCGQSCPAAALHLTELRRDFVPEARSRRRALARVRKVALVPRHLQYWDPTRKSCPWEILRVPSVPSGIHPSAAVRVAQGEGLSGGETPDCAVATVICRLVLLNPWITRFEYSARWNARAVTSKGAWSGDHTKDDVGSGSARHN
jgi:hypothetical protein